LSNDILAVFPNISSFNITLNVIKLFADIALIKLQEIGLVSYV